MHPDRQNYTCSVTQFYVWVGKPNCCWLNDYVVNLVNNDEIYKTAN